LKPRQITNPTGQRRAMAGYPQSVLLRQSLRRMPCRTGFGAVICRVSPRAQGGAPWAKFVEALVYPERQRGNVVDLRPVAAAEVL
jgi:hypothetical protein